MSAPEFPYPYRYAQPLGMLRLRLAPTSGQASEAGVWWPYGRDLTREGPHLVDDFPRGRGRVDRLVYSPGDWDVVAEEVFSSHGRVKVGFLPPDQTGGLVLLRLSDSGIIRLRVAWVAPRADLGGEPSLTGDPSRCAPGASDRLAGAPDGRPWTRGRRGVR